MHTLLPRKSPQVHEHQNTYTKLFILALSLIRKKQKQDKCPSAMEYVNRLWYIYTLDTSNKL